MHPGLRPSLFSTLGLGLGLLLAPACGDKDDTGTDGGAAAGGADGGAADGGASECFGGNESLFEDCMIADCCDVFGPCMGDSDCYVAYSCLLRCVGTFADDCATSCGISGNAAWDAFASCGLAECGDQTCTYGSSSGG